MTGDVLAQKYAPGSLGALQRESKALAGLGARHPALEATLLPPRLLTHTVDHVRGIAATLDAEQVLYSSMSLIRPALESASTAFFLLAPDVDERERVRRWATAR